LLGRVSARANDGDVQSADSLNWSVMSTYVYRFVGLEALPGRLTDFDLQQFFQLGVRAAAPWTACRAAAQPPAASGRNAAGIVADDRQPAPPLRAASDAVRAPTVGEGYLGLRDLDPTAEAALVAMLGLHAADAYRHRRAAEPAPKPAAVPRSHAEVEDDLVRDVDPRLGLHAFSACTMMPLRA
jgi:hypothetical protein